MLGAPRKMTNNKWKSFNVSITLTCLHKLFKFHNLVKEGHKDNLLLAILEYYVCQSKYSQCKQTR